MEKGSRLIKELIRNLFFEKIKKVIADYMKPGVMIEL